MGNSTDAILFYGYMWQDEVELFPDDDWQKVLLNKRGHQDPWDNIPKELALKTYNECEILSKAWVAANQAAIGAWYNAKDAVDEELGIVIGRHCSESCLVPYVAVTDSEITAKRGYPRVISSLDIGDGWDAKLESFFDLLELEKPHQAPAWWLASYWG